MKEAEELVGRRVFVRVNEFIDLDLQGSIYALAPDREMMLLQFDDPLGVAEVGYKYAVASVRFNDCDLGFLMKNRSVGCNVTWVSEHRYNPASPFDLSWWRGGAAAIGDVVLLP